MGIKTHSMLRLLLSARANGTFGDSLNLGVSLFACHSFYKPKQTFSVTAINQLYLLCFILYILMIFSRFVNFLFLTSREEAKFVRFLFSSAAAR
jgi:hypothetical protein